MLNWASRFDPCCYLDSNGYANPPSSYECLVAAGATDALQAGAGAAFSLLREFQQKKRDWIFGYLSYDLKNELEALSSANPDGLGFPDLHFFCPGILILLKPGELVIAIAGDRTEAARILEEIRESPDIPEVQVREAPFCSGLSDREYLDRVGSLQQHIRAGDCYEVNFCREFHRTGHIPYPVSLFQVLNSRSPAPFAAYYRLGSRHLACASPERFLRKTGQELLSQPIKGTAPRKSQASADHDQFLQLLHSGKDRAENIMTVDLVRNDLSRAAAENSVQVDELCTIRSYAQVHQMISSVRCRIGPGVHFIDAIRYAFPMGSMTGAPKIRVMQLIESHETARRGLFSGAVGYIDPQQDFDFNVVIRAIQYNAADGYLSFQSGSAITCRSVPALELEECRLKAAVLAEVLQDSVIIPGG